MRERGLKLERLIAEGKVHEVSLPMRERGLKRSSTVTSLARRKSLPMRERGLKPA